MKKLNRETLATCLLMLAVFCFFLLFFFKIHALVLFDTDDFLLAYGQRDALPTWQGWNPSRVLAESLAPIVTLFGAFVVDVFFKDHFLSVSFAYALTVSLLATALAWMVCRCLAKAQSRARLGLVLYFLVCHFWVFRTTETGNIHMLYAGNVSCYFYYVIPNLLNCLLVLWLMQMQMAGGSIRAGFAQLSFTQKSLFVLAAYFAIFSNIWASIILGVYVGACSLFDLIRMLRQKRFALGAYLKEHLLEAAILVFWAVQQVFELSGGRADSLGATSYGASLWNAVLVALDLLHTFNPLFLKCSLVILVLGVALAAWHKEKAFFARLALLATAFLVEGVYLTLTCARVSSGYLRRPDVNYGCFFFGMLLLLLCAGCILRHLPAAKSVIPLLLVIAVCNCNTPRRTFEESTMGGYPPAACMRYCNDILQQLQQADQEGRVTMCLVIPSFPAAPDNWPAATYGLCRYTEYFYKMGLLEKQIEITKHEIDFAKNAELLLYK